MSEKIIIETERESRIYNKGIEVGKDHAEMSPETKNKIDAMGIHMEYIKKKVDDICERLNADYVTYKEFQPIKTLVFGFTGLILIAVIGGLMTLILK